MKVSFFPEGDEDVSASRIRAFDVAKRLAARGHDVTVHPGDYGPNATKRHPLRWRTRLKRRMRQMEAAIDADVWVVHRGTQHWGWSQLVAKQARRQGIPLVFDFDDAVHMRAPGPTRKIIQAADLVLAGNDWLATAAREWNSNAMWFPTGLDTAAYDHYRLPSEGRKPVVGWIGGISNLHYLQVCADALRRVHEQHPFTLKLVTDTRHGPELPFLHGLDIAPVAWRLDTAPRDVASFDIGLMPLKDSPWEQGKCGFKALEYFAAGAATIATLIGDAPRLLGDETRGWGVPPGDEGAGWAEALGEAVDDVDERQRRAEAARNWVRKEHDVEVVAKRLAEILEDLVDSR